MINDKKFIEDLGLVNNYLDVLRSDTEANGQSILDMRDELAQNAEMLKQIVGTSGVIEIVPAVPYIALRVIDENGNVSGGRLRITNNRIELLDENDLNVTWIEAGEMSSGAINFTELSPRYFNGDEMTGTLKWIARRNGHLTLKNIERS